MSLPFPKETLAPLKILVELCKTNPDILNLPDLSFVKEFIENFGGKIPSSPSSETPSTKVPHESPSNEPEKAESEPEEEPELDMTGVIEPDNDPPQEMGDFDRKPTEEEMSEADDKRSEAMSAFGEKNYEKAIDLYTSAIVLNPNAALLYAKRGQVYLEVQKPNACIRDCNRALTLNPDSAAAHKFRGRAYQLLGKWEEAATDLRLACQFDFDEQADEWLRQVTPNASKILEQKRKQERKAWEAEEKMRQEAIRKAKEAAAKAAEASSQANRDSEGEKPAMADFLQYLNDPEVLQAFQDPEVSAAFSDISSNPANILKYQKNKKIMDLISKVSSKFSGGRGMPGGFPGMMGGMPGEFFAGGTNNASAPGDDVGLD